MNCYPIHQKNRYAVTYLDLDHALSTQNEIRLDLCSNEERSSIIVARLDAAQALMLAANSAAWDNNTPITEFYHSHAKTAAHFCHLINGHICVHVAGKEGYVELTNYLRFLNELIPLPDAVLDLIQALANQCCGTSRAPICSYREGALWIPAGTRHMPIQYHINKITRNHSIPAEARILISALVLQAGAIDIRNQGQKGG